MECVHFTKEFSQHFTLWHERIVNVYKNETKVEGKCNQRILIYKPQTKNKKITCNHTVQKIKNLKLKTYTFKN